MAKLNRWKSGGNLRVLFRKARRATIQKGKGSAIIFFGTQTLGVNTVRSLNRLLSPTKLQKDIMRELSKVQKRIAELEKRGFVFGGKMVDFKNGKVNFTQKFLEELKKWSFNEIKNQAIGYKGTFGYREIQERLKEEKRLRREERKRIKEEEEAARVQEMIDQLDEEEYYPDELEMKIGNIITEEYNYMSDLMFNNDAKKDLWDYAMNLAQEIIQELEGLSPEEMQLIVDWYENNGSLQDAIDKADNKWRGLFYNGAEYNEALLFIIKEVKGKLTADDAFTQLSNEYLKEETTDFHSVNFEWDDI